MSYQVIARKYRPGTFADITAQEHITHTIQNALRLDRVGHGYIFSGLRGVGKTTAARVFAKAVNCQKMIDDPLYRQEVTEPCGECESCRDFDAGTSLNISEFDAASNNSVDDIRQLRENVRYGPQKGRYRVYIIDEVHMLSTAAFNAFLKTLEEPPAHAIFIFATTELHKIPATISSRCQRFNFKRIPIGLIQSQLQMICRAETLEISDDALLLIARKAQGSMRDAQSILDQVIAFSVRNDDEKVIEYERVAELLNYIDDDQFFDVSDAIAGNDPVKMLQVARFVIDNGYDEQDFLEKLIEHFRNFLVLYNLRSTRLIERTEAVKERYQQSAGSFSASLVMQMIELLMKEAGELKFQFEYQFRFELTLLRLIELAHPGHGEQPAAPVQAVVPIKKKAPEQVLKTTPAASRSAGHTPGPAPAPPSPDLSAVPPSTSHLSIPDASCREEQLSQPPVPDRDQPGLSGVDFSAWQGRLMNFTRNSPRKPPVESSASGSSRNGVFEGVVEVEKFRMEWNQFLESLLKKRQKVLVTHLRSCELTSCSHGVLVMTCGKKFSYEELMQDSALLLSEIESFYGIPVKLQICYDATKDAMTREQTIFTLFRDLAETNDVMKYIIKEFGGELVY